MCHEHHVVLDRCLTCHPPTHQEHCWACRMVWPAVHMNRHTWLRRVHMYEEVVEFIEAMDRPMGKNEIWRAMRGGPELYHLIGTVLRDLTLHGLVRCAKRDRRGCMGYEVCV